jgi:paraquat-inducible protein B
VLLFSLDPGGTFGPALAAELGRSVSPHEDRSFEDGEHKVRPLVDPRGRDVYVVTSLHGGPHDSPHDKLCRLLLFIATLREHGAARVSAVVPYLAYARKDRGTKPFDPIATRYVAARERIQIRVLVTIYPDRLRRLSDRREAFTPDQRRENMDRFVAAGLRAQLRTGNLVTGQMYVALDFIDDAAPAKVAWNAQPPELPTSRGELAELQSTLASIAKKLDAVPYAEVAADLRRAIGTLESTLKATEATARKLSDDVAPDVQATLADTRATLSSARRTLAPDSALQVELQTTLREVAASARALRELAETLERRPEALLRGKPESKEGPP